uniref:Uncharacterized protein n=1 Tax=Lactuca sativa TaxID=4236 RepID=A0A9R1WQP2_LACSA|nr:hypothetical protein LSAT_V11C100048280 [Lactuca sativa]
MKLMDDKESTFEEIIDAYLAYLQVTFVNPAMDRALSILQKFTLDAQKGKIRFENLKNWKDPGTFTEQDIDDWILKQQQEEKKKRQRQERKKEKKLCPTNGYSRWIMCITQLGQVPYLSFRFNKLFKASGYQVSAIVGAQWNSTQYCR